MKVKIILSIIFFFLLPYSIFAKDFSFSLETHTGIISGLTQEYVYEGKKQLSRLEWEEKAVPFVNAALDFSWKHFLLRGNAMFAVPGQFGVMQDYDYLLLNSAALTNYSRHEAWLEKHTNYDLGFGYGFVIKKKYFIDIF